MASETGDDESITSPSFSPVVLVVDDERDLVNSYTSWLSEICAVREAYDGEGALAALDEDVDVVLLDRQMPGLSGAEVLSKIRDEGYDCRVAMVTAVEPDFDIVDMPFDDYIVKPVEGQDLIETVDNLLLRSEYNSQVQELFSLIAKKAVLMNEKSESELRTSDDFELLEARIDILRARIENTADELLSESDSDTIAQELAK